MSGIFHHRPKKAINVEAIAGSMPQTEINNSISEPPAESKVNKVTESFFKIQLQSTWIRFHTF